MARNDPHTKASSLSFRAAVVFVLSGMTWRMTKGISLDHSTMTEPRAWSLEAHALSVKGENPWQ